ncbi:hypothetical protein [Chitinophaga ginsengisegetis]|uniref:hypothetical protein n=1 Tax=Chitinophaga ginsengisegetis TaxID=393003 RepID=UPI000DBAC629|nr:hypothetical protein [Chitinophaga ginsengisegetis]MDR6570558.1 hypothetical protein [Chitinophaga ginsengisegetis]MDR6650292.1 hypothetical protein [Chitinophaga ginsengisegetis]MDR6656589.1 hypothetical protein [Chitinophaga ginsengisegetis]
MAKQTGILQFTGRLGNIIGYRRNGSYFIRTMPETVRQTSATRKAAQHFGIASRKGKLIRHAISPHLDIRSDGALVNRLNKILIPAGREHLKALKGFRFNRHCGLEYFFPEQPVMQHNTLQIPAQIIPSQETATHLVVKLIAVRLCFKERCIENVHIATATIDLNQPFNGMELETAVPGKGSLLVILQVQPFNGTYAIQNKRSMAADIIAVAAPAPTKQKTITIAGDHRIKSTFSARIWRVLSDPSPNPPPLFSTLNGHSPPGIVKSAT